MLQLQVESLKTKASKAAEFAIKLKKESDESPKKSVDNMSSISSTMMGGGQDTEKRMKELEKKVTKLRNESKFKLL